MYLGIDLGTSSVKTVVLDERGSPVAQASAPLSVSRPRPGYSEQDPEAWWRATLDAVTALPLSARAAVRAVGVSGQMHGATLLDERDRPLRPAILWNDGRADAECRELERRVPGARAITGTIVMPGFTAPKLLWIARHEPDLFQSTCTVLLPKDFIRLRLTGEKVSDLSDASGTAWLDVAQRDWSDAMLEGTGLSRVHMPRLIEGTAISGRLRPEIAQQLGLTPVPVAGGGGDNAASAVGLGVVAPGQTVLSLGTSGVLFVVTDRFRPNPQQAAHAFCHCLPARWHQMAVLLSAASTLDWVAQALGSPLTALVERASERGLRRETPYMLPYLTGERTPHNDPNASGVLFGLRADTDPADIAVAALEGVALALADGRDVLRAAGGTLGDISVTGGGARLAFWGELIAAALNSPLSYRTDSEPGAARGAARLARLSVSGESIEEVCGEPQLRRTVVPDASLVALLAERRPLFQRLYRQLQDVFQESGT